MICNSYQKYNGNRDFLYESLFNSRLLWAKTWNNEYESESEYDFVSRITIWINFHVFSDPYIPV